MSIAIRIENVSKLYRLGNVGTGTISHDLNRWWHQIRGKEDPYAKVGQVNDRTKSSTGNQEQSTRNSESPDYVWALRDINLEVQQGEILGIIGRNGAGKSTLLKLLSRVTAPTTGSIKTRGRIASLLEVGTGFHQELTGRENIYLNGAILGMKRLEIARQLDEIVAFSGCAKYLDTPVKRYSSGMLVRLAFAVASHLPCETLIVDEVLAVGDAEFQKKCLGKMREISDGSGRTVLFVSHNMGAVMQLCSRAIVMSQGQNVFSETPDVAIKWYEHRSASLQEVKSLRFEGPLSRIVSFSNVSVNQQSILSHDVSVTARHPLSIRLEFEVREATPLRVTLAAFTQGVRIFSVFDASRPELTAPGHYVSEFSIPPRLLRPGRYWLGVGAYTGEKFGDHTWCEETPMLEVLEEWFEGYEERSLGLVNLEHVTYQRKMTSPSQ